MFLIRGSKNNRVFVLRIFTFLQSTRRIGTKKIIWLKCKIGRRKRKGVILELELGTVGSVMPNYPYATHVNQTIFNIYN